MKKARILTELSAAFSDEITDAITEDLFGTGKSKSFLPFTVDDRRIGYYVARRYERHFGQPKGEFSDERDFFELYWPRRGKRSPQILLVDGCGGVGKSTFLQYFFRHFLPHYHQWPFYNEIQEGPPGKWRALSDRHIVLCANMHRVRTSQMLYPTMWCSFNLQLTEFLRAHKDAGGLVGLETTPGRDDKAATEAALEDLAKRTYKGEAGEERKYFITWIFDNTDLMPEELQLELLSFSMDRVEGETPQRDPYQPVASQEDNLWKIIIPLRPETYERLLPRIDPCRNKEVWTVDPVCEDELDKTRGELLEELITATDRHVQNIVELEEQELKPPLKLTPPDLAGRLLRECFTVRITDRDVGGEAPIGAQRVYNDLVDGSARRYLLLRQRLAMSRSINRRIAAGRHRGWAKPRLSPFYFLDGLLCGHGGMYRASDEDNLILNLYAMGTETDSRDPYSLLVGVHVICLLSRGTEWHEVARKLMEIGYPQVEIEHARTWLILKGVLKLIGKGENGIDRYDIRMTVAKAHWSLLCERAYTDNVAISLAGTLGLVGEGASAETDALDYDDFAQRIGYSCGFLLRVRRAQNEIRNPVTARARHQQKNEAFRERLESLGLPDVHRYVAAEYRLRVASVVQGALLDYLGRGGQLQRVYRHLAELPAGYQESIHTLRMVMRPE